MQPRTNNITNVENPTDSRSASRVSTDCFQSLVPDYALLFFDHLYSEYRTLKSRIKDPELIRLLESLHDRRQSCQLTWSDIYTFDLALIDERPLENLIRKAYDARAKYRSIAGQKEFDEYVASKPPDLTSILIAPSPRAAEPAEPFGSGSPPSDPVEADERPQSAEIIQRVLRADIRYLLSKFYLYYAMLPMRESMREDLTNWAVTKTKKILGLIVILILVSFGGVVILERMQGWRDLTGAFGLTVGAVVFAGIVGGCVSMLQRIQSAPSEGDALFNLASLTYGWTGLSLSPLYGGIFASLLFVLFSAGILEGSIFPRINTPGKADEGAVASEAVAAASPTENPTPPLKDSTPASPPQQAAGAASPTASELASTPETSPAASTPEPSPEKSTGDTESSKGPKTPTATEETGILQIKDFLKLTGPKDGVAFALLIIWSFIAGFAERLVPDTLNRLVAKNEAVQGTKV